MANLKRVRLWAPLALVALACAGCASDQPHGRHLPGDAAASGAMTAEPAGLFLAGLDANLDGVVTKDELIAAEDRLWAAADADKNGTLSIVELDNWRVHWLGTADGWPGQFHFDTDGNSLITRKEFDVGLEAIFDDFDSNKDGKIERSELLTRSSQHEDNGQRGGEFRRRSEGGESDFTATNR